MRGLVFLALFFVNTAISEPKHFKSFDGNYTLEFGFSDAIDSFKVDTSPYNNFDISIYRNIDID